MADCGVTGFVAGTTVPPFPPSGGNRWPFSTSECPLSTSGYDCRSVRLGGILAGALTNSMNSNIPLGRGTIVAGDKPRNVYIRALGPTLTSFGVPGALQDTVITLYQGTNPIASNDDWGGGGTAFGNRLVQNGNPPVDSRESALIARLEAGHYTVFLEGKGGSTGVGLIEINEY
jgi:hypothetical protein